MIDECTILKIREITKLDPHDDNTLMLHTMEELGELAAAITIEDGVKNKPLREPSKMEAVDTIICALSVYFRRGGTPEELDGFINLKLNKWEQRLHK